MITKQLYEQSKNRGLPLSKMDMSVFEQIVTKDLSKQRCKKTFEKGRGGAPTKVNKTTLSFVTQYFIYKYVKSGDTLSPTSTVHTSLCQGCQTWDFIPKSWESLKVMGCFWDLATSGAVLKNYILVADGN